MKSIGSLRMIASSWADWKFADDRLHADVPDAPRLLLLLQGGEVRRIGRGRHHDQVDLGHLEPRQQRLDVRFHGGGAGLRRAAAGAYPASTRRACSESRARWQP